MGGGVLRAHVDDDPLLMCFTELGDDLVPVAAADRVNAALRGFIGHAYGLRSTGGASICAPAF
jgi:hypothetical protein